MILALLALTACQPALSPMGEPPPAPKTRGLADLHVHQFSSLSFGGAWLWGDPTGPPDQALAPCSGRGIDHGFITGSEGPLFNLGRHDERGYPGFEGWPKWSTTSHQQVHAGWLQEAHAQGLDLMVMSAVETTDFCELIPKGLRELPCDDFESVTRQLEAARAFERDNADWYEIVESPPEARAAIAAGKLAVVLAVEAGDVFHGVMRPFERLDTLREMGVVALQPVHETDNRFAGAAWHSPPLWVLETSHLARHPDERAAQRALEDATEASQGGNGSFDAWVADAAGFVLDARGRNVRGLSDEGRALIQGMMDRGMIVDVSHLSERSIVGAYVLSKANDWYPLFVSHGHFKDLEPDEVGEWSYGLATWRRVLETGGMVGVRSSATPTRTYVRSGVVNDCEGSSKSFAQRLAFVHQELGLPLAFASDFGGLASNLAPRFGPEACAKASGSARRAQAEAQDGRSGLRIDARGWGHIGQIGEVMQELRRIGLDTTPLEQSAEAFLQMWERVEDADRRRVLKTIDVTRAQRRLTP